MQKNVEETKNAINISKWAGRIPRYIFQNRCQRKRYPSCKRCYFVNNIFPSQKCGNCNDSISSLFP